MAGSLGFKDAMAKAGAVVLEPVSLAQGDGARGVPGRRHGRHQRPPRPGAGHRCRRRRRGRDHRPRADVGDPALRDRPALDDRRPGPLHRDARSLRPHARRTSSTSFRSRRPKRTERPLPRRRGRRGALVRSVVSKRQSRSRLLQTSARRPRSETSRRASPRCSTTPRVASEARPLPARVVTRSKPSPPRRTRSSLRSAPTGRTTGSKIEAARQRSRCCAQVSPKRAASCAKRRVSPSRGG